MEHSFDIELAKEYGILEAILMKNIWFWILKNKANNKHFYDENYWTYNSARAFAELFPYVSQRQITNALKKLENEGILQIGNYNKLQYDRTLWYAFTEKGKCIMQKCKMENAILSNGNVENVKPIPDNKPNKKTNNKHIYYGEYKNVFFTEEQYNKLKEEFPNDYEKRIQSLDDYMQSSGKKYKDCLATIRNWARKEGYKKPKEKKKYKDYIMTDAEYIEEMNKFKQQMKGK